MPPIHLKYRPYSTGQVVVLMFVLTLLVALVLLTQEKAEVFQPPLVVASIACQWGEAQAITCRASYDTTSLGSREVMFVPLVWHLGALTRIDSVAASKKCTWRDDIRESSE